MHDASDADSQRSSLRVGVYSDIRYMRRGDITSSGRAFVKFVTALPPRVAHVVVAGRLDPRPGEGPYRLPDDRVRFVPLPDYPRVTAVVRMVAATRGTVRTFRTILDQVDVIWVFGPHPLAVVLALMARRARVPLVLGVRQDYVSYIRNRLPSRWWSWAVPVAWVLEWTFRRLGRSAPTVALGSEIAGAYRRGSAPVLETGFSLVSEGDIVGLNDALARAWGDAPRIVSVGRLDPEKNPFLLLDILERVRVGGVDWRLIVAGDGPCRAELEAHARRRGLAASVAFLGEVANGPALWETYRSANVFLHVSLTEGLPQVLFEALAAGLPVVATDVGGVSEALDGGRTGLLIPPRDAGAAAAALERVRTDSALRSRLIAAGLDSVHDQTLERHLDQIAAFLAVAAGRQV